MIFTVPTLEILTCDVLVSAWADGTKTSAVTKEVIIKITYVRYIVFKKCIFSPAS